MNSWQLMLQIWIAITCCISNWLIQDNSSRTKLIACVVALAGQPAWFVAAWQAQQWGIFFVDILYTLLWMRGALIHLYNIRSS